MTHEPPRDEPTPDWWFQLDDHRADGVGRQVLLDSAAGAMAALRTQLKAVSAMASHVEHCLRAAAAAGVPLEQLAGELDLRPVQLQAVLEGQQPLISETW